MLYIQILIMFVSVFFIDRVITFIPTYSKTKYQEMNLFSVILVLFVLGYESHTKVGSKTKILLNRFVSIFQTGIG